MISKEEAEKWASESINFNKFWVKYNELIDHLEAHDNEYPTLETNKKLSQWVKNIRQFYKRGAVEQRRIDLLEQMNFLWIPIRKNMTFEERIQQLLEYKKENGSLHVSQTTRDKDDVEYSLSRWVNEMRRKYQDERLSMNYIDRLNQIGFIWNMEDEKFERKLGALKRFHKENGHFDVPQKGRYKRLGNWVATLRCRGVNTPRYKQWLDQIGFVWDGIRARKEKALKIMLEVDMNNSLRRSRKKENKQQENTKIRSSLKNC